MVKFQNRHSNVNKKGQKYPTQPKKGWIDEYSYKVPIRTLEVNAVKL